MRVDLFDFDLPPALIAQHPADPRDSSRLLHVPGDGAVQDRSVRDLPEILDDGDLLVVNDTKVIPTRLYGHRGEVRIEATLIEESSAEENRSLWTAFAKPGKRLRPDDIVTFADGLSALVHSKLDDGRVVLEFPLGRLALRQKLWRIGRMPLPPYIKRSAEADDAQSVADRDSYQTVFAEKEGAVAAPTASLHFTPALLDRIAEKGIQAARITLHVGAGTFLPVKSDDTKDHVMHSEWAYVSEETATRITNHKKQGGRIVAVGTTALRTLESAAREGSIAAYEGETDLFITPGFEFRVADRLITNFHLPKSTLFMLVSAFSGLEVMKSAYAHAVAQQYRFFSYGDACLLERPRGNA